MWRDMKALYRFHVWTSEKESFKQKLDYYNIIRDKCLLTFIPKIAYIGHVTDGRPYKNEIRVAVTEKGTEHVII